MTLKSTAEELNSHRNKTQQSITAVASQYNTIPETNTADFPQPSFDTIKPGNKALV